jgi:hypothetical protein
LRTLARNHLDTVDGGTDRDVANRQRVAHLDRRLRTTGHLLADDQPFRRDDVTPLTIGITEQGNVRGPVRIVLEALDLGGNPILVALEVDQAIVLLVAAALVPVVM